MTRSNLASLLLSLACALLVPMAHAAIDPGELVAPKVENRGGDLNFTVSPSLAGRNYQLQVSDTMAAGSWTNVGVVRSGDGGNLVISHPYESGVQRRFYRVALVEATPAPAGFSLISAGEFMMGNSLTANYEGDSNELPQHPVTLSAFYMGKYEVTWSEWMTVRDWAVANGYPDLIGRGAGKADNHPVQTITWYDMVKWCNARSEMVGLTPCYMLSGSVYRTSDDITVSCNWSANGYRLPTEAEWEKAARGGLSGKRFPWGDRIRQSLANYYGLPSQRAYDSAPLGYNYIGSIGGINPPTSPVGSFPPNGYGLYDMAGNVYEWCWDLYSISYYATSPETDPRGASLFESRVIRGGVCFFDASYCRVAYRSDFGAIGNNVGLGFRLARSSVP